MAKAKVSRPELHLIVPKQLLYCNSTHVEMAVQQNFSKLIKISCTQERKGNIYKMRVVNTHYNPRLCDAEIYCHVRCHINSSNGL